MHKVEEFSQAAQDSDALISALEAISHGYYARITDADAIRVVAIYANKIQLVNGAFTVSTFKETDSMLLRMRYLTAFA